MALSLKFGTSGLRGLASELAGVEARRYAAAFISHLRHNGSDVTRVFIGRDLRDSSPAIAADVAAAVRGAGAVPVDCGALPTPALALHAMEARCPSIMVTGSHIPADRNGLKFYAPSGEITKADEAGILAALPDEVPHSATPAAVEDSVAEARDRYHDRYAGLLAADALKGWRIGVFEHASVARDLLVALLEAAGADVVRLGRSETFVAVDTEALSDAIFAPRHGWIAEHRLDAIVSTDGDGDRPLLIDAHGGFVRGDALGLITATALGADTVVTPVTSNSGIEDAHAFRNVRRTQVGSPFVIAAMEQEVARGGRVVGFEANGGALLGSDVAWQGHRLTRLPTRDAILPLLATLATAAGAEQSVAALVEGLKLRAAFSDRLADVPSERGVAFAARLASDTDFLRVTFAGMGEPRSVDQTDGSRVTLTTGDVVHYRASGNAPELRCYVEGETTERAETLLRLGLDAAAMAVRG